MRTSKAIRIRNIIYYSVYVFTGHHECFKKTTEHWFTQQYPRSETKLIAFDELATGVWNHEKIFEDYLSKAHKEKETV
jgi:hypothetical protein